MGRDRSAVRIALLQMDARPNEKPRNLDHACRLLDTVPPETDIACFPEFFTTGYHPGILGDEYAHLAEPIPGPTTERFADIAATQRTAIIGGIVESDAGRLYNTAFVIDATGKLAGIYRKTHLFPTETEFFEPGDDLPVFDLNGVKVAVATCFDHAFPEIFSAYAVKGAQIVFIPSCVPEGYEYLLDLRSRARAQDNQIWVAAVNRCGIEGDVFYCGRSQVINPRGEQIIVGGGDSEEVLAVEAPLDEIDEERQREPNLSCRRPELYG